MDRLALLERMAAEKPDEPFVRYGLALEYRKVGRHGDAVATFDALTGDHPEYLAAYLMYGNLLGELGRGEQAAEVYERGMALARSRQDEHTLGELQAARAELG